MGIPITLNNTAKDNVYAICEQWRSQDTAYARAQRGHTTFVGISTQNEETNLGVWGDAPPENLEFLSFPGRFWGYSGHTVALNQDHSHYAGFVRGVKSLHYSRQTHVQWDQGSVRDFVIITKYRTLPDLTACDFWGYR